MKHKIWIVTAVVVLLTEQKVAAQENTVDICIYGATSAGIIAAYTAKKSGKSVIVIEPGTHIGGLTAGGLGMTDIGNKFAITGISRDFYRRIGNYYGKMEHWIFEPHVASKVFQHYIDNAAIEIVKMHRLSSVVKKDNYITQIIVEKSDEPQRKRSIKAKVFMDCTYEGDLMAKAGVSYTTGREANAQYGETYNGVQLMDKNQFPDGVDPYKTPGDPSSGLLWGISSGKLSPNGTGDKKIQAYNFRICLTNNPQNRIAITRPDAYDSTRYELLLRYLSTYPAKDLNAFLKMSMISASKTDINNSGPFSTDYIGYNYDYPEADYATREKIKKDHENYNKGLLYFAGHDQRMPAYLREMMLTWGYPKDEYVNNGNWSPQMYVRESRRMIGEYVMTQANCQGKEVVDDEAGMAAYTMDSHNTQRVVVNGMVKNEGDVQQGGFGPYPVSYRSLVPKKKECANLLVPVCLSATHIAYGSIRMEPVFMVLAQSSAVAASMAIDQKIAVQDIDASQMLKTIRENPLADGSLQEILVDNEKHKAAVTLKGNWKNATAGGYGSTLLLDDSKGTEEKSARFTPNIEEANWYEVFYYLPMSAKGASVFSLTIFDGKQKHTRVVKKADVIVLGQTKGEWVKLGRYNLPAGNKSYVEISNKDADGDIVADAILFIPERKKSFMVEYPEEKLGWKLGSQAFTFQKFSFFEAVDKIDSCGLKYVEAYPGQRLGGGFEARMDYKMDATLRRQILHRLEEKRIQLYAFGVVKASTEADWRQLFEFGKAMGIKIFTAEPEKRFLPFISRLCEEYKIDVAIHNHPSPSSYWSPDSVLMAIMGLSPRIGACADIGHWIRSGVDPVAGLKKLNGRIYHLHMKDLNEKNNKKAHDVIWGTGVSGIAQVVAELKRQRFKGMISVEYEHNWTNSIPEIIPGIQYLRKLLK